MPEKPDDGGFFLQLAEYRKSLVEAEQSMQSQYDKSVMLLSGGALGLSFAFLKDIVGTQGYTNGTYLICAWLAWGLSITLILFSFFTSSKAMRKAIEETDARVIYLTMAKSCWSSATRFCNVGAGICFFVGVALMVAFAHANIPP